MIYGVVLPGQNTYLPPDKSGYIYDKPYNPLKPPTATYKPSSRSSSKPAYRPPNLQSPNPEYTRPQIQYGAPVSSTIRPLSTSYGPHIVSIPNSFQTARPPLTLIPGGSDNYEHHHHHHEPGMPFDFNYSVNQPEYRNDFSHNAISDGDTTKGEYRVQLPDGRTQVVKYTADWKSGYHAQIRYEGQLSYSSFKSSLSTDGYA